MRLPVWSVCVICFFDYGANSFSARYLQPMRTNLSRLRAVPGADIEQTPDDDTTSSGTDEERDSLIPSRGKLNEIDFCIAPADVSISRAYSQARQEEGSFDEEANQSPPPVSLTRLLNNASNRAVRRILLARAWPSAEALNQSLQRVSAAEKEREALLREDLKISSSSSSSQSKCPVPRPILNILMRRNKDAQKVRDSSIKPPKQPVPRSRTDQEYVADQLAAFKAKYGEFPRYEYAEAYLESILSLATSGKESIRALEVLKSGVYAQSYSRVVAVLKSVGAVFEDAPGSTRRQIAEKLADQDICLSMIDKIELKKSAQNKVDQEEDGSDDKETSNGDLGGLLLSSQEPTMTRELNSLSNIVQRALLFGGDQELLVLSDTLLADRSRFAERWYPGTNFDDQDDFETETRPGVQYLNCLIKLMTDCYNEGVVTSVNPPLKLGESYANAFERLIATLVTFGSGYIKPATTMTMPSAVSPKTASEEIGRFAMWEAELRQRALVDFKAYPEDLEGVWEVEDLIGGESIGISTVALKSEGVVEVAPPLEGLRWRLDPGPTHLDTCTFQVLNDDKTILEYRGFIDRGARLEARFSKRSIRIRGAVTFQMRVGRDALSANEEYFKDILPINYRTGTTKFVMTKKS